MGDNEARIKRIRHLVAINWTEEEEKTITSAFVNIDTLLYDLEKSEQKDKMIALLFARQELQILATAIGIRGIIKDVDEVKGN